MKKKAALIITAALMLAAVIIGGTMASFQAETSVDRQITTTGVGIKLVKKDGTLAESKMILGAAMPGDTKEYALSINNTEQKAAYIRVTVNKSWQDDTGKKVFQKEITKRDGNKETVELDAHGITLSAEDSKDWIMISGDTYGEVEYYYYKKPLEGNTVSSAFVDSVSVLKEQMEVDSNAYAGMSVCLEFDAEAVQTTGAKSAILAEWGMEAEIGEDGVITSIAEQ